MTPVPLSALAFACALALPSTLALAGDGPPTARIVHVHPFQAAEGHDGRTALVESRDGTLIGVTIGGGAGDEFHGGLFRLGKDGDVTWLAGFPGDADFGGQPGSTPVEGADGAIYGTTQLGGANDYGTIWRFDPASAKMTTLFSFAPKDAGAIVSNTFLALGPDGWLYGTSQTDGASGRGFVFRLRTDGSGFQVLHDFSGGDDGAEPLSPLVALADGRFVGTASRGAFGDCGVIYTVSTAGTFTTMNALCDGRDAAPAHPDAELVADPDGNLYGASEFGGAYGGGTVFRRNADGSLDTLHSFIKNVRRPYGPSARLVFDDQRHLYGVTRWGGEHKFGTIWRLDAKHGFDVVYAFGERKQTDGRYPWGPLTRTRDGRFLGMTAGGGPKSFFGSIYELEQAD